MPINLCASGQAFKSLAKSFASETEHAYIKFIKQIDGSLLATDQGTKNDHATLDEINRFVRECLTLVGEDGTKDIERIKKCYARIENNISTQNSWDVKNLWDFCVFFIQGGMWICDESQALIRSFPARSYTIEELLTPSFETENLEKVKKKNVLLAQEYYRQAKESESWLDLDDDPDVFFQCIELYLKCLRFNPAKYENEIRTILEDLIIEKRLTTVGLLNVKKMINDDLLSHDIFFNAAKKAPNDPYILIEFMKSPEAHIWYASSRHLEGPFNEFKVARHYLQAAKLFEKQGQQSKIIEAYKNAAEFGSKKASNYLIEYYSQRTPGKNDELCKCYLAAAKREQSTYFQPDSLSEAIKYYKLAFELDPKLTLLTMINEEEVIERYKHALTIERVFSPEEIKSANCDNEIGEASWKRSSKESESHRQTHQKRALDYKYPEAIIYFQKEKLIPNLNRQNKAESFRQEAVRLNNSEKKRVERRFSA